MDKQIEVAGSKNITLAFIKEVAQNWKTDDKGKRELIDSESPNGEKGYVRNDAVSLTNLLDRFDTRQHSLRDWKDLITLKKKLYKCYIDDKGEIILSESECDFLKGYLKELPDKEGKDAAFNTFDLQTLFYLKEQLGD